MEGQNTPELFLEPGPVFSWKVRDTFRDVRLDTAEIVAKPFYSLAKELSPGQWHQIIGFGHGASSSTLVNNGITS